MGIIGRQKGRYVIESLFRKSADGITARAGGGKALATQMKYGMNRITVCATGGDSVLMPRATAGVEVLVCHDGAAAAQVFGAGTDTIDAVATGTGNVIAIAARVWFYCFTDGQWQSFKGVKTT